MKSVYGDLIGYEILHCIDSGMSFIICCNRNRFNFMNHADPDRVVINSNKIESLVFGDNRIKVNVIRRFIRGEIKEAI